MTKAEMKARRRANRRLKRQEQFVERMAQERVAEIRKARQHGQPRTSRALPLVERGTRMKPPRNPHNQARAVRRAPWFRSPHGGGQVLVNKSTGGRLPPAERKDTK